MKKTKICFLLLISALFAMFQPAAAQGPDEVPVAVISLVWGEVTLKHSDSDYQPARWLDPIYPGDLVKTTGPGSKLLITFFSDNHQEVMGEDITANVAADKLVKVEGQNTIRRDPARNPFGAGGVENPFIYTHKLVQDDFKGADVPGALAAERPTLQARVRSGFPPTFAWKDSGAASYTLNVQKPEGGLAWSKEVTGTRYKLTRDEGNSLLKGVDYKWGVTAGTETVVREYEFMLLTLPLKKWFDEQVAIFDKKRDLDKLQRSVYTDYLLVCSQVLEIDRAMEIAEKMRKMDPNNPRIFRILTRIYLRKGCPAHAKAAHDKLVKLGGRDPIYP